MKEMVSIVVPVYQAKCFIKECIESLISQTYDNIEIVLIDDGSTDGSSEICKKYERLYPNVYYVKKENEGVSIARNIGLNIANGKYIMFVDSDDFIHKELVQAAVGTLQQNKADIVIWGYSVLEKNRRVQTVNVKEGIYNYDDICKDLFSLYKTSVLHNIGCKLYKKEIMEENNLKFNEEWTYFEDIYFCLSYLVNCKKICLLNKAYYYYRKDVSNSLSKKIDDKKLVSIKKTFIFIRKILGKNYSNRKCKEAFYFYYNIQIKEIVNNICLNNPNYFYVRKVLKTIYQDSFFRKICQKKESTWFREKNLYCLWLIYKRMYIFAFLYCKTHMGKG